MLYRKSANVIKIAFFAFISIVIISSLQSCARKITFLSSSEAPSAIGKVKIKKDKNGNYEINISLQHLAPSDKLQPPANTYVVWIVTEQNETKNMGQISSSSGFLSKKLKASFNTVSPSKPVKVFITAEDNGTVFYPGSRVVLTTKNF